MLNSYRLSISKKSLNKKCKNKVLVVALKTLQSFVSATQQNAIGAFYTISYSRFMRQWAAWNAHMPNVTPYYAVKCNPEQKLLKWIQQRGGKFDCASAREMYLVYDVFNNNKSSKDSIIFANPCKTPNDIEVGKQLEIPWVVADSVEEFVKMNKASYKPDTILRVSVDDSSSVCPFNVKFGLAPEKVEEVALAAKSFNIPIVGLSFHVGSGCKSPFVFGSAVSTCKDLWSILQKRNLVNSFDVLDLGGGWSYKEKEFQEQAMSAQIALRYGPRPEKIIAEPGRFFAAPTHNLYVQVIGKKPMTGVSGGGGWRYTLDESIYGQFSCIPFDHAKPELYRIKKSPEEEFPRSKTKAVFFGRTCDSLDWIATSIETEELEVGDWLFIPNMGAYTTATSTEFNGFPKPNYLEIGIEPDKGDLVPLTQMKFPLAEMLNLKELA